MKVFFFPNLFFISTSDFDYIYFFTHIHLSCLIFKHIYMAALKISSLVFRSLTMMYLDVGLFGFILLGICPASWVCHFLPFTKFGKFSFSVFSALPCFSFRDA